MHSRTLITAAVLAAAFCTRACAEIYQDPQQRFTLNVPAGWTAEAFDQGSTAMVDGQPAAFTFSSGVNKGVASFLQVTAVAGGGTMYGIIAVVPQQEFQAAKPGVDQIAQGFHAAAGGAGYTEPGAVPAAVARCRPGDTLQLTLVRDGRQAKVCAWWSESQRARDGRGCLFQL